MTRLLLGLGVLAGRLFPDIVRARPGRGPARNGRGEGHAREEAAGQAEAGHRQEDAPGDHHGRLAGGREGRTGLTLKIDPEPGAGVTLTSSFGPFKGEMTLEEVLNKICEDKSWGWYVNVRRRSEGRAIFLPRTQGARL